MSVHAEKENLEFQTEVQQLLKLMIHSLYSNSEIFLRELVSNASDAADKLRFEALQNEALYEGESELAIRLRVDKEARTLHIRDNGIGMSRDEVVENLGTIAHSGTRRFLEQLSGDQAKDAQLIGQFGVGFYSAFIVADRVTVLTRKAGLPAEQGVRWESDGQGGFTVENVERSHRGTEVILHLNAEQDEFLEPHRLRHIIRTYSDHIAIPVLLADEEGKEEAANSASALWMRPKNEISDEEYQEFYKHVAHDFEAPLRWVHNKVEGNLSYTSLLYLPRRAPFDLFDRERRHGIKLYVRRVFIMDDTEQLMPGYLRFVRGVVDSDDLPLNVSRELLQHNRVLDKIRGASVKRVLDLLERMADKEPEEYAAFWEGFGRVLKEGPAEDPANRERIAKLLRFASTHSGEPAETVSLDAYIARMKEGQKHIYYVNADGFKAAAHSPHLEVFRKQGIEVLLLSEPVDEWLVAHLHEYQGKSLQSVAKGDLDLDELGEEEKKQAEQQAGEFQPLLDKLGEALGERVEAVRLSRRLTESPACLVVSEHDMGLGMQKLFKAAGHDMPMAKPSLELNPQHALIQRLREPEQVEAFEDWALLLFEQAQLAEGGALEDPAGFVRRMNSLLSAG
ncbi:molecular chaperone HtpG [Alkalilimnicola sp. S0819]|uniref:molecular chaperone HtpG n=1 Tax=Alkalilimnicola sp. S0819 TaxID=2613922 RepID=UPI0012615D7C|nr:molecular chaperone HtpG [Alkalilimnicola sp. S0819]KAB7622557.1 molecular chaperone HtpG [Alkalilimnicola sp. S0819]MPQ17444.1 molecular chaperone HtpG [Alkalilimnicola sp. S0819]